MSRPRYGACWWRRRYPTLPALLDADILYPPLLGRRIDALLAWGRKREPGRTLRLPGAAPVPVLTVEDGFLRSVDLGFRSPPLSVVLDRQGIYYDAGAPSDLESHIAATRPPAARERARRLMARWQAARVSKYNHAPEAPPPVDGPFVLAIDQTAGDASIGYGLASAASFTRMLEAALAEHPDLPVVLKVHPDVVAGRKQGHFDLAELVRRHGGRVVVVAQDLHAPALLAPAAAVYTVTSQVGFEALLWNKPVRCFGMPFYAGWGLTGDDQPRPARRAAATPALEDLVHAALIDYPRYLDPASGTRGEVEQLVDWLGAHRRRGQA